MVYLAPGITAAIVVLVIELFVRFHLYKKHNFQEAMRIQMRRLSLSSLYLIEAASLGVICDLYFYLI